MRAYTFPPHSFRRKDITIFMVKIFEHALLFYFFFFLRERSCPTLSSIIKHTKKSFHLVFCYKYISCLPQLYINIHTLASSQALCTCDKAFYFLFFGFTCFTHSSFILFFYLKLNLYQFLTTNAIEKCGVGTKKQFYFLYFFKKKKL